MSSVLFLEAGENILGNRFTVSSQGFYVLQLTDEKGDQLLSLHSLSDGRNQIVAQVSMDESVNPVGWSSI